MTVAAQTRVLSLVDAVGEAMRQAMEAAPKSVRWKMRARVGEKVTWYELPEETG